MVWIRHGWIQHFSIIRTEQLSLSLSMTHLSFPLRGLLHLVAPENSW